MKVESIAECSSWSILQYFWPAISDNWSWKLIICLFESDHFTQVLLYLKIQFHVKYGSYCLYPKYFDSHTCTLFVWLDSKCSSQQFFSYVHTAQGHNTMTPVRLELATPRSRVEHSTTEPLLFPCKYMKLCALGQNYSCLLFNSFIASGDFRRLLITFANSMGPDLDRQSVGPDQDPNRSTIW